MAIEKSKVLFEDPILAGQLSTIKGNFKNLVAAIASLEERLPLIESVEIVEKIQRELTLEPFATKLSNVLSKNPDFGKVRNFAHILKGTSTDLGGIAHNIPFLYSLAPITSVDCES